MAADEGVIRQELGFSATQAINELDKLNAALITLGNHLAGMGDKLGTFNASANQTVASLTKMSTAANATLASMTKLASAPTRNLDAALGVGKVTEGVRQMQDAARLGTSTYGNAVSSMTGQTRVAASAIADANKKTKEWVVSWNTLARVVMTQFIVRGLSQIRDAFSDAYTSALDFTKAVSEIRAISPERSLGAIADEVRRLSDTLNQPLARTVEAQYQVISDQFVETTDRLNIMTAANALAKVGADDLAASAQLLTGALNAYGESSDMAGVRAAQFFTSVNLGRFRMNELGMAMGRVQSIGHEMGVSMEELQAALISITIGGVKSNEAATQLRGILNALMKPTEAMKKAFRELGIESGETAVKTWGLLGALEKVKSTTDGSAQALGKLLPNVRGSAGAMRLLAEGAKSYYEAMEALREVDMTTLQKTLKDFMDTPAEKLTKELNKLANFFTADFGMKLIDTLNKIVQLIGGANGLISMFKMMGSMAADAAILGLALAFGKLYSHFNIAVVGLAQVRQALQLTKFEMISLRGVMSSLVLIELGRILGNQIGTWISDSIEAPQKAIREALDAELKMRKEQSAALVREKERANNEMIQKLRQSLAETNKLYVRDSENFKIAAKVQEASVKDSLEKIMAARQKMTHELVAAAESAQTSIVDLGRKIGEVQQTIEDKRFADWANKLYGDIGSQFDVYRQKTIELTDAAVKLQSSAKDPNQAKLADDAWKRAEAYAKQTQEIAKQNNNEEQLRQTKLVLDQLDDKRLIALKAQQQVQRELAVEIEARARQAESHNAELERDREEIQRRLSQWTKNETGQLTLKGKDEFAKDLGDVDKLIASFTAKLQTFGKADFVKEFLGDPKAFEALKREAERSLASVYIRELEAAPEAMAKLRAGLQESLDKAGLSAPVIVAIQDFTGKDVVSDGLNAVLDEFQVRWNNIMGIGAQRALELGNQAKSRAAYTEARGGLTESLGPAGLSSAWRTKGLFGTGGYLPLAEINAARAQAKQWVEILDVMAKSDKVSKEAVLELKAAYDELLKSGTFDKAWGNTEGLKVANQFLTMVVALNQLRESQDKTPAEVSEKDRKQAEVIKQQIDAYRLKEKAQKDAAAQVEREKAATGAVKTDINDQVSSLNAVIQKVDALAASWRGVSSAMTSADYNIGTQLVAAGGMIRHLAEGGLARGFDVGGFAPSGTDTIPAMLSPGEFVINAASARRFASQLVAMNAGIQPTFRSEGGSVTNVGDINVTVSGGGSSRQTARSIASELRRELRRGTSTI